jgi:hypothetical protein
MKQGGLDLLYLPSHIWILVGQRCSQRPENGIKLVHITASLQPLMRLAHTLAAEKTCLAMIACACIDLNGSPPCFPMFNDPCSMIKESRFGLKSLCQPCEEV